MASLVDTVIWKEVSALAPTGGRQKFLTDLVGMLHKLGPELIAAMRQDVEKIDAKALRRHAHKLNGCAAHVGAGALAALCAAMELSAREGRMPSEAEPIDEMQRVYDATVAELNALCLAT